ncbi:MAG TPA: hypothetical protein VF607_17410 [Verrucomicrobiae bacterium]
MITNVTSSAATPLDIRDIKPPLVISGTPIWFWPLIILAGLVLLGILVRWLRRSRPLPPPVPPVPPHVRAREKLAEALNLINQPKPFVVAVSDATRAYLEERFHFHAPERTTEEFLHELAGTALLLPAQKASLAEFLSACDLVKFARYEPGENELRALHAAALRLVEETTPLPAAQSAAT